MRVKGDAAPNAYSINDHPTKSDYAIVKLCENAEQYTEEETSGWVYDEYALVIPNREDLADDIETNYSAWITRAKNVEYDRMAETVRSVRDKLLEDSDTVMLLDRMGLVLPDTITATTMLAAVRDLSTGLKNTLSGEWAQYRERLRDIPEQAGFPYAIEWPRKPEE